MATCSMCGNEYDKTFDLVMHDGSRHTFDSFECAIHMTAPRCAHCGCTILGHGVEDRGTMYCCVHCARKSGEKGLRDRLDDGT